MRKFLAAAFVTAAVLAVTLANPVPVQTQAQGTISNPVNVPGIDKPVRVIKGRFTSSFTLTPDTYWVLRGAVFVAAPAQLVVLPGTWIIGETYTRGTLVIERGAQIIADGLPTAPIVMTSDQPIGLRNRADWGGLILNGNAPVHDGQRIGEGGTGFYGGTNPGDSSGILRYVRVEFAGIEFSPDNELNGISFQGVGNGTLVDHIQVHFNLDDAIEFFGGTVDVKHAVLTESGDDNLDWTFGWTGRAQFVVVQQRGDDSDNIIEADNNGNNFDALPRSSPTVFNVTFIGDPTETYGPEGTDGMRLRVGTAGRVHNFIVMGMKDDGIDVRDASAALPLIASGELDTSFGILFNNLGGNWASGSPTSAMIAKAQGVAEVDPLLVDPYNQLAPDWRPQPGSPALTLPNKTPPMDGFFEPAPYLGALRPEIENDWTKGWTNFAAN